MPDNSRGASLLGEEDLQAVAAFAALLLVVSTSIRKNWSGAVFGIISTLILLLANSAVAMLLSAMIVIPIVIEVRWSKRAEKDLVSGVIAAAIIGAVTSWFLVFHFTTFN